MASYQMCEVPICRAKVRKVVTYAEGTMLLCSKHARDAAAVTTPISVEWTEAEQRNKLRRSIAAQGQLG